MPKSRLLRPTVFGLMLSLLPSEPALFAADAAAAPAPTQIAPAAAAGERPVSPGGGRRGGRGRPGAEGASADQAGAPGAMAQTAAPNGGAPAARGGGAPAATGGAGPAGGGQRGGGGAGQGRGGGRGGRGGAAQAVEVTPVQRRDLIETIVVVGSVTANESSIIRPEISGIVREINFNEGQAVRKGDVILKLDDSELRAQYNQAESAHRIANLTLQRVESLMKAATASQAELDRAQADYTSAKANLDLLSVRLARTEIRAPFDGVVNARALSPGDLVTTQTQITTIDDLSRLKIDFQVPERYIQKARTGNPIVVRATSGTETFQADGEVYFVSSTIDRNTRSIQVKGILTPPAPRFRPGMFANVELVLEIRKGVLTVPEGAILASPEGVQIIASINRDGESIARFVDVKLGLRTRGLVEVAPVREGELTEGMNIVGAGVGSLQLFNGGRLTPRPLESAFQSKN
jgi:membrane fusion protein (multidrug efflux system)